MLVVYVSVLCGYVSGRLKHKLALAQCTDLCSDKHLVKVVTHL